jgi:hypothetical protein
MGGNFLIKSSEWEGQVREFLNLVKRYDETNTVPPSLIDASYSVVCEAPDLNGIITLYTVLLDQYPSLIHYFQKAGEDGGEDDGGPLGISSPDETKPKSFKSLMRSHEHGSGRGYQ